MTKALVYAAARFKCLTQSVIVDVDRNSTDRTLLILLKPLVDTLDVKDVQTRKTSKK